MLFRSLKNVRALAESCARQLTGWERSVDGLPFEGRRHLPAKERKTRETAKKVTDFRMRFLQSLKPDHPLYQTPEARAARGEMADGKASEGRRADGGVSGGS